jgi:hypothetical protein
MALATKAQEEEKTLQSQQAQMVATVNTEKEAKKNLQKDLAN